VPQSLSLHRLNVLLVTPLPTRESNRQQFSQLAAASISTIEDTTALAQQTASPSSSPLKKKKKPIWTLFRIAKATVALVASVAYFRTHSFSRLSLPSPKRAAQLTACLFVGWQYLVWRRVKQRQAVDATSEWGRYARKPGARGRALVVVMGLAATAYLRARVTPFIRGNNYSNDTLLTHAGAQFTTGLLQLGPLYIKLGQILSCRPNLLPAQWVVAMERLQDAVPAQSGAKAWELARTAWPANATASFDDTFSDFNDVPLAAASLGQVHTAVLKESSQVVAIKLQRPYLRDMYDQDFALLTKIAKGIDAFTARRGTAGGINCTAIFQDAEEILYREIDYRDEAENAVRFAQDFGLGLQGRSTRSTTKDLSGKPLRSAAAWLRTPYVYAALSSEKVLVMEFVPSIKITNTEKLRAAGVTDADKEYLADCLARAYLRQFCCHFFFSTDPHPGNLGVEVLNSNATAPSERVRIVFYDFGQATTLQPIQGEGILEIVSAIVDSDVGQSMESFEKMGVLTPEADLDVVRAKIADNFKTGKVKANRKRLEKRGYQFKPPAAATTTNATTTTEDAPPEDADVMKSFTLPPGYAFVGRALSQMDGVGKSLDPDFDFISSAAPWIYEVKGVGDYLKEEVQKWLASICDPITRFFPRPNTSTRPRALLKEGTNVTAITPKV
jgi:predicted unusual protein kinase regulating ubiquinone biosynthesis (AarF/ABC1/UbiB family)